MMWKPHLPSLSLMCAAGAALALLLLLETGAETSRRTDLRASTPWDAATGPLTGQWSRPDGTGEPDPVRTAEPGPMGGAGSLAASGSRTSPEGIPLSTAGTIPGESPGGGTSVTIWDKLAAAQRLYPWLKAAPDGGVPGADTIGARFTPPPGYRRVAAPSGSFAEWLRGLPLKPGRPPVRLFDGRLKPRQDIHAAVVDLDIGPADLHQCADTIIRLRAEYLRVIGQEERISFRFTSGHPARWPDWSRGLRPVVSGNAVTWRMLGPADNSYGNFRAYLDRVFLYAGTLSLAGELAPVPRRATVEIGDVFIRPGSPGHAVFVVDAAEEPSTGRRAFLLLQGFMPAQEVHILANPADPKRDPWYDGATAARLTTPEWTFERRHWMRFPESASPAQ